MFLFDYLKKITMKTIKQKLKQNPSKKPGLMKKPPLYLVCVIISVIVLNCEDYLK
jgi:hypothetical protein